MFKNINNSNVVIQVKMFPTSNLIQPWSNWMLFNIYDTKASQVTYDSNVLL